MATLQDLLNSGMSRDEINALLSQSSMSTDGFQGQPESPQPDIRQQYGQPLQDTLASMRGTPQSDYEPQQQTMAQFFQNPQPPRNPMYDQPEPQPRQFTVSPEDGLQRLNERPGSVEQAQMNTIRNNTTGEVTNLPSSGRRSHDVYTDGPQVLKEFQNPDGTIERIVKKPTIDGFGRQTTVLVRETVTPDYLNPAMLAKQKYEGNAANIAQTDIENKAKQMALAEASGLATGGQMTAKQYEARHGKIPSGFEIYHTETGETDIRPVQGGKQYLELQDRVHKFDSSSKGMDEYGAQLDKLTKHPGRESATGFSSITNPIALPGGDAKDFLNELETFQSQAFLSNIDKLRGTGPLSNVEGEKLQAAVGNLNVSSNEDTFKKNLADVKKRFESLKEKAKMDADNARGEMKREKPKLTSADGDAMAWAMKNPNDPRSAAIKAKLGVR